ncbi:MAG: dodecin family protein [Gemmatimonadota bacterium]|jgi:flavin-binding protein dodecin
MSVAKVIEVSARSPESFEDAAKIGVERASETVDNIQGVWIKEMKADVKDGKLAAYRVDMKVTFVLN